MVEDATSINFLKDLRDPANLAAWARFAQRYAARVRAWAYRWCRRWNLAEDDARETAEEVAQALLAGIHDKMAAFDLAQWSPGGFRRWLRTVTHNALVNYLQRRARERGSGDSGVLEQLRKQPAHDDLEQELEHELQLEMERRSVENVKCTVSGRDWQIVEALGFADGRAARWQPPGEDAPPSVANVAASFGLSPSAVLAVKSRVLKALRAEKDRLQKEETP
jgi:RNA polymerase sigma factor (sigma-70 family)